MNYLMTSGPATFKYVTEVSVSNEAMSNVFDFMSSIDDFLMSEEERAVKAFAARRSFQSTGLKSEDPAAAIEPGYDHPWDKTREEIGLWWLYEEPCEDDFY